jgi:DNA-binding NarL/FixJ family response regulator
MTGARLRVAIVADPGVVHAGVRSLLHECPTHVAVVPLLDAPQVVVYDLARLAQGDGELLALVRSGHTVVGLERDYRHDLYDRAWAAGIVATFTLDVTREELVAVLTGAADGGAGPRRDPLLAAAGPLSEREAQILRLVAAGKRNDEIAQELYLSVNTIKTHLRKAYAKIGVSNRSGAIVWYLRAPRD